MIRRIAAALLCLMLPIAVQAQALPGFEPPKAGLDYQVLVTPVPTFGKGKIEVAEIFSYGCHHCYDFQPHVNKWKKVKRPDVRFEYVPAAFGGPGDNFARAFFAAQAMGVLDKTHEGMFKGIFVDKAIQSATPAEIADVYARMGVDRAKFLDTMASPAVTAKLAKARQFALDTEISGTPTIIVNGKYRVMGRQGQGMESILRTTDFLVARERALLAGAK